MDTIKKIGILGGSFNPAHAGHLQISQTAMAELNLDEIWWVITSANPEKDQSQYQPLQDRIDNAKSIIGNENISIYDFESQINSPYTADLIDYLQNTYNHKFVWLMGADNLNNFVNWQNADKIINNIHMAIFNRPSFDMDKDLHEYLHCDKNHIFKGNIADFIDTKTPNIVFIKSTNNETSSSKIRNDND